ncbi:MAG: ECF transporter S component [bacterium]|nr:ECF transporter S component [bacterium]
MKSEKLQKLVIGAMFAALCFLGTFVIKIPTFHGYIHIGDCMVILSGIILGPIYGSLAAGIGSMLSDLLGGYVSYVPGTFVIKALAAAIVALLFRFLCQRVKSASFRTVLTILCGICSGIVVVLGYLVYEGHFLHLGVGAVSSIPGNIVQGISGIILSTILYPVLVKIPDIRHLSQQKI